MNKVIDKLIDYLNKNSLDHLNLADDTAPPPYRKYSGYKQSHTHRIAIPLSGCHKMDISKNGKVITIRPTKGWATLLPHGVWNQPDWKSEVEVATFIFGDNETYVNYVQCPGLGRVHNNLIRIKLPPLDKEGYRLLKMLLELDPMVETSETKALLLMRLILLTNLEYYHSSNLVQYSKSEFTFQSICSWLDENWASNPTRGEVASLFNLTPNYISNLFNKQSSGKYGYSEYVTRLKILHASKLLKNNKLTLAEVGFRCGFNELPYFCRVFKKIKGMSPTEYRVSV